MAKRFNEPGRLGLRPGGILSPLAGVIGWILFATALSPQSLLQAQDTNDVPKEQNGKKRIFNFEGGSPVDFIVALDRHFRTRLMQILTLPETLSRTKVPKLRVAAEDPREVLTLYNRLESPTLGQWRFEPTQKSSDTNMNVLMLVPDKAAASGSPARSSTKVKAVALAGIPQNKWETLMRDIDQARAYGEDAAKGTGESFAGSIRVQPDSKILIVVGSQAYLEMVDSLVEAHRVNSSIEANPPPTAPALEPKKSEPTR